jgi:hypothetical protein
MTYTVRLIFSKYNLMLLLTCISFFISGCSKEPERPRPAETTPSCPEGNEGCACKEDGTCNTLGGVDMVCQDSQCALPQDEPDPNNPNDPVVSGFKVEPEQARGCEVVIIDPDNTIQNVTFNSTVKGHWMRRGNRIAVAFFAQENQAITQGSVSFESTRAELDLEMVNLKCVDLVGTPLSNASLSFD